MNELKIQNMNITKIIPYVNNQKKHPTEQVEKIMGSIKEFGVINPIIVDKDNVIIAGHGRYEALKRLGYEEVPVLRAEHLTPTQVKAYRIADNKLAELAVWDEELLAIDLSELDEVAFDMDVLGFNEDELSEILDNFEINNEVDYEKANEVPEVDEENIVIKRGDLIELGEHRLLCGDSTSEEDVTRLMNGVKADIVFTDPPYGMNKNIENDNLNFDKLLEFNKKWIPLSFKVLKGNGSWYCWGIDEPLMDIYSNILKPMIKEQKITFRNLITWDKGNGQGQLNPDFRMYPIADEKCLFVMCGVQGFNNNADNYWEGWEPIRKYLKENIEKIGTKAKVGEIVGVSSRMIGHYVSKSQWGFITEENYKKLKNYCEQNNIQAFQKEYEELKKEYYSTRAYFDNTHDNMNNVWHFERHKRTGEEGGHDTPKPIPLCEMAIKSSSRESEIVLDLFLGSGSTLIACENLKRKCYGMELDEKYAQVIIQRWCDYTGKDEIKINGKLVKWSEYKTKGK